MKRFSDSVRGSESFWNASGCIWTFYLRRYWKKLWNWLGTFRQKKTYCFCASCTHRFLNYCRRDNRLFQMRDSFSFWYIYIFFLLLYILFGNGNGYTGFLYGHSYGPSCGMSADFPTDVFLCRSFKFRESLIEWALRVFRLIPYIRLFQKHFKLKKKSPSMHFIRLKYPKM